MGAKKIRRTSYIIASGSHSATYDPNNNNGTVHGTDPKGFSQLQSMSPPSTVESLPPIIQINTPTETTKRKPHRLKDIATGLSKPHHGRPSKKAPQTPGTPTKHRSPGAPAKLRLPPSSPSRQKPSGAVGKQSKPPGSPDKRKPPSSPSHSRPSSAAGRIQQGTDVRSAYPGVILCYLSLFPNEIEYPKNRFSRLVLIEEATYQTA